MRNKVFISLVAFSLAMGTGACGKKSGDLSPDAVTDEKKPADAGKPADASKPTEKDPKAADTTGSGRYSVPGLPTSTKNPTPIEVANEQSLGRLNGIESIAELINKKQITPDTIICRVGDQPINVSDYRFILSQRQNKVRQVLTANPSERLPLLELARKQNIDLTPDEKVKLVEQAKATIGKDMPKYLAQYKINEQQFEEQTIEMGRALKAASRQLESQLMNEMINTALIRSAARKNGLAKPAFHRYIEFKHSNSYDQAANFTNLSQDQLREKIIDEFLVDLQKKKIVESAPLKDSDVLSVYNEYKDQKFKHHGRIRWSQIAIVCPTDSLGAQESARKQVMRQRPDLKGAKLDEFVAKLEKDKEKLARDILKKANDGKNFGELANQYTEDIPARKARNGGDMGLMSLDEVLNNKILAPVGKALQNMKVGEICQEPIRTAFGWHIVKKTDDQKEGYIPFMEVKDELKAALSAQQRELVVRAWLIDKRKKVPIVVDPEFERYLSSYEAEKKATQKP